MASTYSALKIELLETGANSGTWGTATNVNLGDAVLGEAITGEATVNFASDADVTITLTDSATTQAARNLRLNITESSSGIGSVRNLILGSGCQIEKFYLINNTGTGAKTIKNTSGTGITVPAGKATLVFNNGTNVVDAASYFTSLTLGSALPIASGGTSQTTASAAFNALSPITAVGDLILGNGTNSATRLPIGANGYLLTADGTTASWAVAPSGMVYPGAGIPVSTGSAWTTSKTSPSGDIVGTTDSQTLTSKQLQSYNETVTTVGTVSAATYSIDLSLSNIFDITLGNNVTFTFTNPPSSGISKNCTVILRQDATGSRLATFTNAKYTDGTAPILSTGANQIDVLTFFTVNGGSFYFGTFAMANVS